MRLKPVNDKIVVKVNDKNREQETVSGIILPDSVGEKMTEAEVVAVGEGMYTTTGAVVPQIVEVWYTILYDDMAQSPKEYKVDGEEYVIISQNEILSILKEK